MRKLFVTIAATLTVLATTQVRADPCGAVLCLSTNDAKPWECKEHVDEYFNIREYAKPCKKCKVAFDPGRTAQSRYRKVMNQCKDAKQVDKDRINAAYGTIEYNPFKFSPK